MTDRKNRSRLARIAGAVFSSLTLVVVGAALLILFPGSPLPPEWNPREPLQISVPVTPITSWKLRVALNDRQQCLKALETSAGFDALPDFVENEQCHIRTKVALRALGRARLTEVDTRCQTALRMAMWMEHGIQPAAAKHLDQRVDRLHHLSSYNCRTMRTGRGETTRMSTHATADAIDVVGVTLSNDLRITLLKDWNGDDPAKRAFLREVRDSACKWFRTTLSPDYNRLHADHFHLQHTGWGTCR